MDAKILDELEANAKAAAGEAGYDYLQVRPETVLELVAEARKSQPPPDAERLYLLKAERGRLILSKDLKIKTLRGGLEAAVRDLEAACVPLGTAGSISLRSIVYGLRLILAQTSDADDTAAAIVPDDTPAAAEVRPCETSMEEEAGPRRVSFPGIPIVPEKQWHQIIIKEESEGDPDGATTTG